jgi:hypothetical protein
MSALAEEGLREIGELSSSSSHSLEASIKELLDESPKGETQEKIRAMAIDMEARMLALYQLAALKAKRICLIISYLHKIRISSLISCSNRRPR